MIQRSQTPPRTAAPPKYDYSKPHGCCPHAHHRESRVQIIGRVEGPKGLVGFVFRSTCCGTKSAPAAGMMHEDIVG